MKRFKKIIYLTVRRVALRRRRLRTYYWAEAGLYSLRDVNVMPVCYYRWLYRVSMKLIESGKCPRLADRAMHTIPYHLRFHMA